MKRLSGLTGLLLLTFAFMVAPAAQAGDKDASQAPGILPSGYSDSVDRDVMKVREATAKFKTTEAAAETAIQNPERGFHPRPPSSPFGMEAAGSSVVAKRSM